MNSSLQLTTVELQVTEVGFELIEISDINLRLHRHIF